MSKKNAIVKYLLKNSSKNGYSFWITTKNKILS